MLQRWSKSWCAAIVSVACVAVAMPVHAKVKEEIVTPQRAAESRVDPQMAAQALRQIGDPVAAGMRLDKAAAHWGDPILYMDAAEAWLDAAAQKQDATFVDAAVERVRIALDILYFHLDASADKNFRMVQVTELPGLVARADALLERAEQLRSELEGGGDAVEAVGDDAPVEKKQRRNRKADKAMFISGAGLTAVGGALMVMGAAGLVVGAVRQKHAERPDVLGDDYDAVAAQGRRANAMAGVGFGLGGAALAAGITLMLVAKRKPKGKRKRVEDGDTMVRVSPTGGSSGGGVVLTGRF